MHASMPPHCLATIFAVCVSNYLEKRAQLFLNMTTYGCAAVRTIYLYQFNVSAPIFPIKVIIRLMVLYIYRDVDLTQTIRQTQKRKNRHSTVFGCELSWIIDSDWPYTYLGFSRQVHFLPPFPERFATNTKFTG